MRHNYEFFLVMAACAGCVPLASAATLSYYRFEGNLNDSAGGVNGTVMQGAPTFDSLVPANPVPQNGFPNGTSLDLPIGAAVAFDHAFPFNTPGPATLEFWVRPNQNVWEQDIFWTTTVPGDANRFNIFLGSNIAGGCTFNFDYREPNGTLHPLFNSQQAGGVLVPFAVPVNQWTFIAVTRTGDTYSVYINNSLTPAATAVDHNPNLPTNSSWSLNGRYVTSGSYGWFSGQVDEVRLSNTALLPAYLLANPEPCPGDCDCDGLVGFSDIDYFVAAIPDDYDAWAALYAQRHGGAQPSCPFANCDANTDGHVNFADIDPFVALIPSSCP